MNPRSLYIDDDQVVLLLIDPQIDFHDGSLAVPGANEDAERICEMIRKNVNSIGEIFVTLDSHHKKHIAHSSFWSDRENDKEGAGQGPGIFSQILNSQVNKKWFPRDCSLQSYCEEYTRKLETKGRFTLTIWPDHCLIGTEGHAIQDDIQAAIHDWCVVHYKKTVKHIHKGMNCLTEMYSAIEAEVPVPTDVTTTKNDELCSELRKAKRLIICGQALSHCVNFTARDIVKDWLRHHGTRDRVRDIFVLSDGAHSVPGYDAAGEEFLRDMVKLGVTVCKTAEAFNGL